MGIPIDKVVVNKETIVWSDADMLFARELASGTKVVGQMGPVHVRASPDSTCEIVDGLHRHVTASGLGRSTTWVSRRPTLELRPSSPRFRWFARVHRVRPRE
ncbi:MAG: ParB N-terminal domain-containing protein [Thermofilum sp.]